jgi:hypothetical protein
MEIAGYEFNGPISDVTNIPLDGSGVYVVLCLEDGDPHCCLDIGESQQLGEELKSHQRRSCWQEHVHGDIAYCYKPIVSSSDRDLAPNPLEHSSEGARVEQSGIASELQWKLEAACGPNPWQELEEYWEIYEEYEQRFGPRGSDSL